MPKGEDHEGISETGNWNVASDFSKYKIMKNLYLADEYSNIAIFGTSSLVEEMENPYNIDELKLRGFKRLINCLILLIDNTLFAIRVKGDIKILTDYRIKLKRITGIMSTLTRVKQDHRRNTKEILILEGKYTKVLDIVLDIKTGINKPLNKAHLIFTDKEEFNPEEFKKRWKKNASELG